MCRETQPGSESREGADAQENSNKGSHEGFRITDRHSPTSGSQSVPLQWSTLDGGEQDGCSGPAHMEGPETSTSGDMQS